MAKNLRLLILIPALLLLALEFSLPGGPGAPVAPGVPGTGSASLLPPAGSSGLEPAASPAPGLPPGPFPAPGVPAAAALASDPGEHPREKTFTLLHTNDEHSALIPHSPASDHRPGEADGTVGGIARLGSLLEDIRARKEEEGEPVLLISAGDFMGGTAFAWLNLAGQAPELSLLQDLGYDVITPGNHEFDLGPMGLAQTLQAADYPRDQPDSAVLVASNARIPPGHPLAEAGLEETALLPLENGLTLGFMGLLGEAALQVTPDPYPVEFEHHLETALRLEPALREEGADLVVAVTHAGREEDLELARRVPGLDIIVGGHSHHALDPPLRAGDTFILQAGAYLSHLGMAEFAYQPESGALRLRNPETRQPYLAPLDHSVPLHPPTRQALEPFRQELEAMLDDLTRGAVTDILEPVAASSFPLPRHPPGAESPAGNFIADAMRQVTGEATGEPVDVAIQAGGQIRGDILPSARGPDSGTISAYDLLQPVSLGQGEDGYPGYSVVSFYLTGEEIRRSLEISALLVEIMGDSFFFHVSGLSYTYDPDRALLGTVPFLNLPLPSHQAVERVWLLDAQENQRREIPPDDPGLYHVVTDAYLLDFLPLAGEVVPRLEVIPRDHRGQPLDDFRAARVPATHWGQEAAEPSGPTGTRLPFARELKVWETVLLFARSQPAGLHGLPEVPETYAAPEGRIRVEPRPHPLRAPALTLAILLGFLLLLWRRGLPRRNVPDNQPAGPGALSPGSGQSSRKTSSRYSSR